MIEPLEPEVRTHKCPTGMNTPQLPDCRLTATDGGGSLCLSVPPSVHLSVRQTVPLNSPAVGSTPSMSSITLCECVCVYV